MPAPTDLTAEWLEPDGLGGFASGTVGGFRSRRYHALLLTARRPPTERFVLVNGVEVWLEWDGQTLPLSTQHYRPDVYHPHGLSRIENFTTQPAPAWRWRLPNGDAVDLQLMVPQGRAAVAMRWRLKGASSHAGYRLCLRPLLSGRDYHALHSENPDFAFETVAEAPCQVWQPYANVPRIYSLTNGEYHAAPQWYRQFQYQEELARGLDSSEDLASPGQYSFELRHDRDAWWLLASNGPAADELLGTPSAQCGTLGASWCQQELARRAAFATPLHRAADAYVVQRGSGKTIIAGYPWFTDWGRDTFIAMRGLCLATGRLDEAREMLLAWASQVSEGMIPNRFLEAEEAREFNAVDASLWFVIAIGEWLAAIDSAGRFVAPNDRKTLLSAMQAILTGYSRGTRFGIGATADGLLAAGAEGVQLTWMDAKVGDWVVTPRRGKPVEVQALWLNALAMAAPYFPEWRPLFEQGRATLSRRFWNAARGCLYDVIDVDHQPGVVDERVRPNQIFAVGGLPYSVLPYDQMRAVVETVEQQLLTPLGLRTLARGEANYAPHYMGGVLERDGAYHQGTAWPWLMGPFVEAWLRVYGDSPPQREIARERFLRPLEAHLQTAGLGHLSEIADAEPPFTPRGCPFQAWSLGEYLWLKLHLLASPT